MAATVPLTIVASVPDGKLALASMADAEALLGIIQRATPLTDSFELPWPMRYMEASNKRLVEIELLQGRPYTAEEGSRLIAEAIAEKARKADLAPQPKAV